MKKVFFIYRVSLIIIAGIFYSTSALGQSSQGACCQVVIENFEEVLSMNTLKNACSNHSLIFNSRAYNANDEEYSVGDEYLDGIIFYTYTDDDGKLHGLVISKIETDAAWQDPSSLVNATNAERGPDNYYLMENSPAKDWILENFSEEWYLPSLDELNILWPVRFLINDALKAGDYKPLSNTGYYWSNREYGEKNAYFLNFEDGDPYTDNKKFKYSVRAIRAF